MTDSATAVAAAPDPALADAVPAEVQSQDYWDIVSSQISKRPSVIISFTCLVILYAIAIYAPFIANDRPLYFDGTDKQSFLKAQRELSVTAQSLNEHLQQPVPSSLDEPMPGAETSWNDLLERESSAIRVRLGVMKSQLGDADRATLEPIETHLDAALDAVRAGDTQAARRESGELVQTSRQLRTTMKPVHPSETPLPGQNVVLRAKKTFPVVKNLSRGEIFFMVLWAMVILFPLWNRLINRTWLKGNRLRIRRARRRKALALLLIPLLAAVLWPGRPEAFLVSAYKDGLTSGEIYANNVVFPVIPYGIAESSDNESFRAPTWHLESEIDEDGYYKFGARAGRFDRATGIPKVAQPVTPKFGELERNAAFRHPLGTDSLGRDMATRLIWGARVSLAVGILATALLVFIGTIIGSVAGYYGGWVDMVISRIIEIVQTFPVFFLILIVVAFIGPSIINIMLAIGFVNWTGVARLVRGEFLRLRGQDFVVASQALGVSGARTIFRHVLPNAMGPVLVSATFSVAAGILIESSLSFLGFGIQLPIPSWGSLLIESRSAEHWWIQIYPGLLIFITVFLYNLCGDGVRDALDPRLKAAR